jgi:hypothetical protein
VKLWSLPDSAPFAAGGDGGGAAAKPEGAYDKT